MEMAEILKPMKSGHYHPIKPRQAQQGHEMASVTPHILLPSSSMIKQFSVCFHYIVLHPVRFC